jgi:DNA sulfur modification protein DndD
VTINFEHNGRDYHISRSTGVTNNFDLSRVENGNFIPERNPAKFIKNLIPNNLRDWFFYDGESSLKNRIDLANGSDIKKSLRAIQGFLMVDLLKDDLKDLIRSKTTQGARFASGNSKEIEKYENKMSNLNTVMPGQLTEINNLTEKINSLNQELSGVSEQLKGIPSSSLLETRKSDNLTQLKLAKKQLINSDNRKASLLANSVCSIMIKDKLSELEKIKADPEEQNMLMEEPYGEQLFTKIKDDGVCICGREVIDGSEADKWLSRLKEVAPSASFNRRVNNIESVITECKGICEDFQEDFEAIRDEANDIKDQIDSINDELKDIEDDYEILKDENIINLKYKEKELRSEISNLSEKKGGIDYQYKLNKSELDRLDGLINKINSEGSKNKLINDELVKLKKLFNFVTQTLANNEKESFESIYSSFNDLMQKYFYDPVDVSGDSETYSLKIYEKNTNNEHIDSTGSNELTKYFFISSVLGIASEESEIKKKFLSEPASFPLLMDAPFTSMSANFSKNGLNALIENINQLVFLALPDAFIGYQDYIKDKIGKAYLIIKNVADKDKEANKIRAEKNTAKYKIYDKEYEFIKYDQNESSGEIKEISL